MLVDGAPSAEAPKVQKSKTDIFFAHTFNNMIKKYKWIFIIIIGAWSIVSIVMALKLSPLTKEESFMPSDFWAEKYLDVSIDGFNSGT